MKLRSNRIYILPTGHGVVFLCSLVVMVLTAATYNNNLIYILAFMLFGVVLISMVQTHVNLKGLELSQCQIADTPQGSEIAVQIVLRNTLPATRETLLVHVGRPRHSAPVSLLSAHGLEKVVVRVPALPRGRYVLSRIEVSTVYPLGLFRAWTLLDVNKTYYVYPKPMAFHEPVDATVEHHGAQTAQRLTGHKHGADFREHRNFQDGDSFQHIDWKAVARNRPLLVKQFEGDAQRAYRFDMPLSQGLQLEHDLSQLAAWILTAEQEGAFYELRGMRHVAPMNAGFSHCQQCLRQLATYRDAHEL